MDQTGEKTEDRAARLKMVRARSALVLDHPFFASLALRLELREDRHCSTAWSDGKVLAYNPGYVNAVSLERIKGLQCHEVLHLACLHHLRRKDRDAKIWNKACDYAINPILLEAGLSLPTGYLDDPAHHGKSADAIYAELVYGMDEVKGGASGGGNEEESRPAEDMDATSAGGDSGGQGDQEPEPGGQSKGEPGDQPFAAAGGDSGDAGEERAESSDPGMSGEVRDHSSGANAPEGSSNNLEEEAWNAALAQALHKARECGKLPGCLERLAARRLFPALGWRELLRRFLSKAARNDFSWVRPNRRHVHSGLYLPGLENLELAEIAVAVDVSGSITQAELERFAAELSAVLEEFSAEITVLTCDAALTSVRRLSSLDLPLDFTAAGGGGTSFRPPFELLAQEGADPACLVYFTDLASDAYPEDPGYPVLWVTPARDFDPPPFGEAIIMEERQ
ncbi:Predicted metal-dependent peptidase [Humidesulfovibrio mexicanus]|uniref:Predicted metal-dependent peptidase n=1 Tax=Humidesulfovibrio mexicanus TaxID=147047 RepID=A0A239BL16_9BACT|nr:VWA-like domain-containing protein [Humidesulfovibrio mexicanus]SNS08897.1 Predicted metal-dependent peptidase [Humidesulfovibrio mexicanus]